MNSIAITADAPPRAILIMRKIAGSSWFDWLTIGVIFANAAVLGAETYDRVASSHGQTLQLLNEVFLSYFVVELTIRMLACWPKPQNFFKGGWNIFDFVVVAASFTPGLRENSTILRLVRLARVTRLVRMLHELRVIVAAVARSIPGLGSLVAASFLTIYVYGMVGWLLFEERDERFGDIGEAMLTMFQVLTLENLPDYMDRGRAITDWAVPYYVSYVLLASFLIFNIFIGIVLNSMEEARNEELRRAEHQMAGGEVGDDDGAARFALRERVRRVREELDAIDRDLDVMNDAADKRR